MLSARSLTRVVALEALETFLPGNETSLGLLGFCDGLNGVGLELDVLKETGEPLAVLRSNELGSEEDSRLRPGTTRPVVSCDWSLRSPM